MTRLAISSLLVLLLAACGGGTDPDDPCNGPGWREMPACVPPIPLPAPAPK